MKISRNCKLQRPYLNISRIQERTSHTDLAAAGLVLGAQGREDGVAQVEGRHQDLQVAVAHRRYEVYVHVGDAATIERPFNSPHIFPAIQESLCICKTITLSKTTTTCFNVLPTTDSLAQD